jgi:hypothetical protein
MLLSLLSRRWLHVGFTRAACGMGSRRIRAIPSTTSILTCDG